MELTKNPPEGISVGLADDANMYVWDVMIIGPANTIHEEAYYKAQLKFPKDFPNQPPEMVFTSEMWHPNIYPDGKVCISILHPPGTDHFNEFIQAHPLDLVQRLPGRAVLAGKATAAGDGDHRQLQCRARF